MSTELSRSPLILCARVSWPVPATRYRTFTEEEDVKMDPLLDGSIARTTRSSSAVNLWRCSWCGARVKVVA